jgi:hypothetical protein
MGQGDGGAERAFDAFVQARSPQLLRTAHLLTGDRQAAERALTAALGVAWKQWTGAPDAAEDVVLRELVAAGKRATAGAPASGTALPEGLGSSDSNRVAARGALRRQLVTMPAELRAVVVLRLADGLPVERVARVLGEQPEQVVRAEEAALALLARDPEVAPYVVGAPA